MKKTLPDRNRSSTIASINATMMQVGKRFDFNAQEDDFSYKIKTAVFLIQARGNQYIVAVNQERPTRSMFVKLLRHDARTGQYVYISFAANEKVASKTNHARPQPIVEITEAIDRLCPKQLELFGEEAKLEFERLAGLVSMPVSDGIVYGTFTLSKSKQLDTTCVDIFYKSENTTIFGRQHKIVMFIVSNDEGRNDVYAACYPRMNDDQPFRHLMSHHKHMRHGKFMQVISQHSKDGACQLVPMPREIRDCGVVCLSRPKSEEGIVDPNFTPMRSYKLIDIENAIDHHTYLVLIDDYGNQVERRANNFVQVPKINRARRAA